MHKESDISAIDMFCGVGGLTHGLEKAGIDVVAGYDIDSSCKYAYESNNNAKFICSNIKDLYLSDISNQFDNSKYSLLVGCAPCQPFSMYTQKKNHFRKKKKDEKWDLLYYFTDIAYEIRPDFISIENVPEIVKHRVFKDALKLLRAINYEVTWKIVNCADYGVPQNRKRLVLLASQYGEIDLIKPTHSIKSVNTVRSAIGHLKPINDGEKHPKDKLHRSAKLNELNKKRIKQSKAGGTWKDWESSLVANCHKRSTGSKYTSVYSRMEWDKPSPTITTNFHTFGTGRFGHPKQNRALSLREGALLQTFPASYKFEEPYSQLSLKSLGTHIGNAVPVKLAKIIGKSIIHHVEQNF